jgi:hypothetical protein
MLISALEVCIKLWRFGAPNLHRALQSKSMVIFACSVLQTTVRNALAISAISDPQKLETVACELLAIQNVALRLLQVSMTKASNSRKAATAPLATTMNMAHSSHMHMQQQNATKERRAQFAVVDVHVEAVQARFNIKEVLATWRKFFEYDLKKGSGEKRSSHRNGLRFGVKIETSCPQRLDVHEKAPNFSRKDLPSFYSSVPHPFNTSMHDDAAAATSEPSKHYKLHCNVFMRESKDKQRKPKNKKTGSMFESSESRRLLMACVVYDTLVSSVLDMLDAIKSLQTKQSRRRDSVKSGSFSGGLRLLDTKDCRAKLVKTVFGHLCRNAKSIIKEAGNKKESTSLAPKPTDVIFGLTTFQVLLVLRSLSTIMHWYPDFPELAENFRNDKILHHVLDNAEGAVDRSALNSFVASPSRDEGSSFLSRASATRSESYISTPNFITKSYGGLLLDGTGDIFDHDDWELEDGTDNRGGGDTLNSLSSLGPSAEHRLDGSGDCGKDRKERVRSVGSSSNGAMSTKSAASSAGSLESFSLEDNMRKLSQSVYSRKREKKLSNIKLPPPAPESMYLSVFQLLEGLVSSTSKSCAESPSLSGLSSSSVSDICPLSLGIITEGGKQKTEQGSRSLKISTSALDEVVMQYSWVVHKKRVVEEIGPRDRLSRDDLSAVLYDKATLESSAVGNEKGERLSMPSSFHHVDMAALTAITPERNPRGGGERSSKSKNGRDKGHRSSSRGPLSSDRIKYSAMSGLFLWDVLGQVLRAVSAVDYVGVVEMEDKKKTKGSGVSSAPDAMKEMPKLLSHLVKQKDSHASIMSLSSVIDSMAEGCPVFVGHEVISDLVSISKDLNAQAVKQRKRRSGGKCVNLLLPARQALLVLIYKLVGRNVFEPNSGVYKHLEQVIIGQLSYHGICFMTLVFYFVCLKLLPLVPINNVTLWP